MAGMDGSGDAHGRPLPVGTQVVTLVPVGGGRIVPAGAVATIVAAPGREVDSYRIRFPDGDEAAVARGDIAVRAHLQHAGLRPTPPPAATATCTGM